MVGSTQRALELSTSAVVKTALTGELHIIPIEENASEKAFPTSTLLICGGQIVICCRGLPYAL